MATKVHKKELIRKQIIEAANIYSHKLAGKKFLYVTPNYYFEILFLTDKFLHLTGVNTKLTAKDFYEKARKGILQNNQFYFDKEHPFDIAKNLYFYTTSKILSQPIYKLFKTPFLTFN